MHEPVIKGLLLRGIAPIGRDRFFEVLRQGGLLVRRRRNGCRTTDSYHRFRTYPNLLKKVVPIGANRAWVSDITYLRHRTGFCYLFLVTDYYSRKIVGYSLRHDLSAEGALQALRMALRQAQERKGIIHHSDRGIQYCCHDYVEELRRHEMQVSMTEVNHCYENAVAERVNGTLKHDLMLKVTFPSYKLARKAVAQAIQIYNHERWHQTLNYQTPAMRHAA
jgi:transposase InsO family protein